MKKYWIKQPIILNNANARIQKYYDIPINYKITEYLPISKNLLIKKIYSDFNIITLIINKNNLVFNLRNIFLNLQKNDSKFSP